MKMSKRVCWFGGWAAWAVLLAMCAPLRALAVDWEGVAVDGPDRNAVADELIVVYKAGAVRAVRFSETVAAFVRNVHAGAGKQARHVAFLKLDQIGPPTGGLFNGAYGKPHIALVIVADFRN